MPFTIALVGSENTQIMFYDKEYSTGNSIFREQSHHFSNVNGTLRRVFTLDTLFKDTPPIDLLKLDIQGDLINIAALSIIL